MTWKGVPNFAVEMPTTHLLTEEDIEKTHEGLLSVMGRMGMIPPPDKPDRTIPIYRRQEYFSPLSGIFFPLMDIMTEVKKGDTIGRIASIASFRNRMVKVPFDGMLIQIHERSFVTTGSAIFAMGLDVD